MNKYGPITVLKGANKWYFFLFFWSLKKTIAAFPQSQEVRRNHGSLQSKNNKCFHCPVKWESMPVARLWYRVFLLAATPEADDISGD